MARFYRAAGGDPALALRLADAGPERHALLEAGVRELVLGEARRYGGPFDEARVLECYAMDIALNAQGLVAWLDSLAAAAAGSAPPTGAGSAR